VVSQFFNSTIAFVFGKNLFPKLEFEYVLVQISSHTFFLWKVCERISGRQKFLRVSSERCSNDRSDSISGFRCREPPVETSPR